jgi:hypothetical protein
VDDRPRTQARLPIEEIPGTVYWLCYDPPYVVQSVSRDYVGDPPQTNRRGFLSAGPIRHYVGWTQQANPRRRIGSHHVAGTPVRIWMAEAGTMRDEERIKRTGVCAMCGGAFADSLTS